MMTDWYQKAIDAVQRDWHTLQLIRAQNERRLPAVLSLAEVRTLLGCVRTLYNRFPRHRLPMRAAPAGGPVPGGLRHRQPTHDGYAERTRSEENTGKSPLLSPMETPIAAFRILVR